jgi:replicative DNA helicase
MRDTWDRIGLSRDKLAALRFDCDPGLELRIVAQAVRDPRFWRGFGELLQPEFFSGEAASAFIRLVHDHVEKHTTPPDYVVAKDLVGRALGVADPVRPAVMQYVDAVFAEPLASRDYVVGVVREMARKRAVRAGILRVAELNERSDGTDPTDEIAAVMAAVTALSVKEEHPVVSLRADALRELPAISAGFGADAVATLLPSLDGALRGGLLPGEVGVVLAPPHRGKTLVLTNLAVGAVATGRDVLFVTLEDGVRGVLPRVVARLTGIPSAEQGVDARYVDVAQGLKAALRVFRGDVRVTYRAPRRTGIPELRAVLNEQAHANGWRPKLLVVDYADRLKAPQKRKDRWDELLDLYMELRAFAEEEGVALWTASQTKQEGFGKEVVDMDDFGGAFAKAAEADIVVTCSQTRAEKAVGEMRLYLAKARNRASGLMVPVYVDYPTSTLWEVPPDRLPTLVCNQRKAKRAPTAAAVVAPVPSGAGKP